MLKNKAKTAETVVEVRATLSLREVAAILGVGRNQIYAAAKRGELPTLKIGSRLLVSRAALQRMLDGTKVA